jgi:hypothetical protein
LTATVLIDKHNNKRCLRRFLCVLRIKESEGKYGSAKL